MELHKCDTRARPQAFSAARGDGKQPTRHRGPRRAAVAKSAGKSAFKLLVGENRLCAAASHRASLKTRQQVRKKYTDVMHVFAWLYDAAAMRRTLYSYVMDN